MKMTADAMKPLLLAALFLPVAHASWLQSPRLLSRRATTRSIAPLIASADAQPEDEEFVDFERECFGDEDGTLL